MSIRAFPESMACKRAQTMDFGTAITMPNQEHHQTIWLGPPVGLPHGYLTNQRPAPRFTEQGLPGSLRSF